MRSALASFHADIDGRSCPPLIILCPPRSFSSVVCAMLGQHPELCGFPELSLFVADTVECMLSFHAQPRYGLWTAAECSPGLLRTLAQLHSGVQTRATVADALIWVRRHRHWDTHRMFSYLLGQVHPRHGIDKSPLTSLFPEFLQRGAGVFPPDSVYPPYPASHPVPSVHAGTIFPAAFAFLSRLAFGRRCPIFC